MCVCVITEEPVNDHVFQNQLTVPLSQSNADSSPDITPGHSPLPRSSSSANLQSASKLILSSKLVYSQRLDLPSGVELIRATPSAGMIIYSLLQPRIELGLLMPLYKCPIQRYMIMGYVFISSRNIHYLKKHNILIIYLGVQHLESYLFLF